MVNPAVSRTTRYCEGRWVLDGIVLGNTTRCVGQHMATSFNRISHKFE